MLTKEQYFSAIERLVELADKGCDNLSTKEKEEQEQLGKETEEFEAYDHKILSI